MVQLWPTSAFLLTLALPLAAQQGPRVPVPEPDPGPRKPKVGPFPKPEPKISSKKQAWPVHGDLPDIEVVRIPAGTFVMGSPEAEEGRDANEGPQHQVSFSRGFWMGKFPVTNGQWVAVMGMDKSAYGSGSHPDNPKSTLTWQDACDFIGKLNGMQRTWTYRLPTEAEWEYAARAGTKGPLYGDYKAIGWQGQSEWHFVGKKLANAFGLYDLFGGAEQWVQDWYGTYSSSSVTDPHGPPNGELHVSRGGGSYRPAGRAAWRRLYGPNESFNTGFRVVRELVKRP